MAATNFTPIQLYFSTTASAVPTAANLAQGELAINITDGKLYYEDNGGVVQVIATKGAGTIGGSTTQIQYNNAGALAGNAAMVFNNSTNVATLTTLNLTNALGAIYGGTAQSTYTQGDFLYASASNTLAKLGIGTVNYILTSTGTVPQWVAPSSVTVNTATNLDGGAAGSVPYQSGVATTTFLAIGTANRVMTSTGTAPQWVTALTGLTGVSSSSITNTSLTAGRVVVSTTAGLQADDADLTFDGTTLSAGGFSTVGLSTLVKTVKIGDSSFNGVAVFAAATPAKLYMGTGTVTDVTSAISATNAIGAIASLGITPIAATNTSVTYTNAATLYIAGAPSAGTNITLTNPYALYVAAGDAYFGGTVTAGTVNLTTLDLTNLEVTNIKAKDGTAAMTIADSTGVVSFTANPVLSGGTANGVTFLNGSKVLTSGSALTFDGTNAYISNALSIGGATLSAGNKLLVRSGATDKAVGIDNGTNSGFIVQFASGLTSIGNDFNAPLAFLQNNSERMRIDSSGNVGIGTTSPAYTLEVSKSQDGVTNIAATNANAGTAAQTRLRLNNGGSNFGTISHTGASFTTSGVFRADGTYIFGNGTGGLTLTTGAAQPIYFAINNSEAMRIDSSGNVGIGTSSPSSFTNAKLVVAATSSAPANIYLARNGNAQVTQPTTYPANDSGILSFYQGDVAVGFVRYLDVVSDGSAGSASSVVRFWTNSGGGAATEKVRIDASGNVGIGTTSPVAKLDVSGGSLRVNEDGVGTKVITLRSDYAGVGPAVNVTTNNPLLFLTNNTERMRIDSSGKFMVGATSALGSATGTFVAADDVAAIFAGVSNGQGVYISSNATSRFVTYNSSGPLAGGHIWQVGNGEAARIDLSGNLLVGATSLPIANRTIGFSAKSNSTSGIQMYQTANNSDWGITATSGSIVNFYSDNGTAVVYAGTINVNGIVTTYTSVSDYRLKENVQPMVGALAKVQALNPVTFTFKNSNQDSQGFIAHELQSIVPDCVTGKKDDVDADGKPAYQSIDTSFLVATLTAAIQEQQALITSLTARITALEST